MWWIIIYRYKRWDWVIGIIIIEYVRIIIIRYSSEISIRACAFIVVKIGI